MSCLLLLLVLEQTGWSQLEDWAALARPWMTEEESDLFDRLSETQRIRFRGYFVARRQEDPGQWSQTGWFLPSFFYPSEFGDIRDLIAYRKGYPTQVNPNPLNPALPAEWVFDDVVFSFVPKDGHHVKLASSSHAHWEALKHAMILHPELRYDLEPSPFGRTRIPEDLEWMSMDMGRIWLEPQRKGAVARVRFEVPDAFISKIFALKVNRQQNLECLIRLISESGDTVERHASRQIDLGRTRELAFEMHWPAGYFQVEVFVYSGFWPVGLQTRGHVFVPSPSLPRLGTPIVAQQWTRTGIEVASDDAVIVGDFSYRLPGSYDERWESLVLVPSESTPVAALLQESDGHVKRLELIRVEAPWCVFRLPPTPPPFRVLALGRNDGSPSEFGFSTWQVGLPMTPLSSESPAIKGGVLDNYLGVETLEFEPAPSLAFLTVNGWPYLASQRGSFSWLPLNWGERAELWLDAVENDRVQRSLVTLRRSEVFEEMRVQPRHVVAGFVSTEGEEEAPHIQFLAGGQQTVEPYRRTPLKDVPGLWGLVIKDEILALDAWPLIRDHVMGWLRDHLKPSDMIYIVHVSQRPEMVLAPTRSKVLAQAGVASLQPVGRTSHFNLDYLIEELTHLDTHPVMPHQVVFLTDLLSEDMNQMQALMPDLRNSGLQLYQLEFPEARSEGVSNPRVAGSPLEWAEQHAVAAGEVDAPEEHVLSDDGKIGPESKAGYRIRFGRKKVKEAQEKERLRLDAAREAFSQQLAMRTAGLSVQCPRGLIRQALADFLLELSLWQDALTHYQLPTGIDDHALTITSPDAGSLHWVWVEWLPPESR